MFSQLGMTVYYDSETGKPCLSRHHQTPVVLCETAFFITAVLERSILFKVVIDKFDAVSAQPVLRFLIPYRAPFRRQMTVRLLSYRPGIYAATLTWRTPAFSSTHPVRCRFCETFRGTCRSIKTALYTQTFEGMTLFEDEHCMPECRAIEIGGVRS